MAPYGAIKFAKWRHVANKWRHLAPISGECALSPNGAIWRQIWRHLAIANLRHSPNLGDTWRYRHVAMRHSLKKTMRKIFIAKWRHLAPFGDKCSSSQMAPIGAIPRQTSPFIAIYRHLAPFIAKCRHSSPNGANLRQISPYGAIWRILSMC